MCGCVCVKESVKRGIVSVNYVESVCGVGTLIQRQFVRLQKKCAQDPLCVCVGQVCTCVTEESDCVQFVSLWLSFHHHKRKCVHGLVCVWWQGAFLTEREQDS